jgi:CRP/FNR family transcriptional regulator, anaerobic regulatory protein
MEQIIDEKELFFTDLALKREIIQQARVRNFHQDHVITQPGDEILFIPIVLSGCLRILRQNDDGQEVFLYHLYPGQTCAMSLTCCQSGKKSMIKAIAELESRLLMIPVKLTEDWFRFPEWKAYISNNYQTRFAELLQVIDLIAFSNMDKQLLHYIKERAKALNVKVLDITHQEIAEELHTHREAISRLLRTMEQKGLVKLGRNSIQIN